jgi:hypothetical protein
VAPLDEAELLAGLREAVDRQLLVVPPDQDAYVFRHALVQEAVYGELLPGERTRLHATLARMLAERLGSGGPGRPGSAAEADGMRAYAEALAHYERALNLWDQVPDPQARRHEARRGARAGRGGGEPLRR